MFTESCEVIFSINAMTPTEQDHDVYIKVEDKKCAPSP